MNPKAQITCNLFLQVCNSKWGGMQAGEVPEFMLRLCSASSYHTGKQKGVL